MPAASASATVLKLPSGDQHGSEALGAGSNALDGGPKALNGGSKALDGGPKALPSRPGGLDGGAGRDRSEVGQRAWRGFLRAHASLAKRLEAELEGTHSLPLSSYEVLQRLMDAPGGRMRMCDLAEQVQLSRSGLTRLVDRLEREQLLTRCSCEHDARGAYACLTELGHERLCAARETHLEVVREHFLSRFSQPELRALADMWDRISPGCCA